MTSFHTNLTGGPVGVESHEEKWRRSQATAQGGEP
jgi:hypothetical protein